ncbi:MAG TPA: type IV secretory system conjugative DNA transfer family protein [Oligoflexus sp.]|uniref:type IV secretory system conjugative DNA transfer family protein n=1 Tax=Oligoflexus sp. TaxID=1971216 RepID=UPI002D7F7C75|nr:type IV secretory system conjugative DNA transfer family protein [Oligoflexus sp.]HET9239197.1 type IV secretory system conjugative DNA transfer family protein [Oligoflexus sp.]
MIAPNWLKWVLGIALFIVATAAAIWLAGFLFFVFSKANPFGKTDFWTWMTYWQHYQADIAIAKRLKVSAIVATVVVHGSTLAAVIASMREVRSLHGEARFANASEISEAGLLGSTGVIIGKLKNRFLMFPGMQFILLSAPTRSGKGVGIVIPNLLAWPESVVALDVKLENFLITSKFRAKWGQEIYLFNPFSITEDSDGNPVEGRTHRYNPLGYISDNPRLRVTDILAIGYSLYPGEGKDSFFDDAARNLFLGLTLYLCETPNLPRTMGELLRQSSGKGLPVKDHIQNIVKSRNYREFGEITLNDVGKNRDRVSKALMEASGTTREEADTLCNQAPGVILKDIPQANIERVETLLKGAGANIKTARKLVPVTKWDGVGLPPLTMECVDALNRFTSTSDNTLSSIMATFNVPLTIWASPIVDAATSANDFDLRDVRKRPMSVYLGIPANKLAEAKLLLNMFYTQLVNLNTNRLLHSTPELKYTCLMLNDEFTAPGRIGIIDKANSYMAGYGLRMLTIIQSPGQLEAEPPKGYGRENARTLVTNHACQIFFTPREQRDANEYSEALGYYTFKAKGKSRQLGGKTDGSRSESESDQRRALMMPQELKEMSQREQIINLENTKAIRCTKINYFSDPVFIDRLKSVSPSLAKLGRRLPSKAQLEAAWGSGECAVSIPALNFDLHEAIVQDRSRETTVADVAKGIDLSTLALDLSKVPLPDGDGIEPEQVEAFVNGFFDALDAVNDYEESEGDGLGTAETGAQSTVDSKQDIPSTGVSPVSDLVSYKDNGLARQLVPISDTGDPDEVEPSEDELVAMIEEFSAPDDGIMDESEVFAALEFESIESSTPASEDTYPSEFALDLSVLGKPENSTKSAAAQ